MYLTFTVLQLRECFESRYWTYEIPWVAAATIQQALQAAVATMMSCSYVVFDDDGDVPELLDMLS